ncbi:MAG: sporulation protein YqfD [Clostridia bacterium]|nr:sporulation protein YqfD [Clostridia bacterium]
MKNLSKICVTASPVQALNKLKRADIPVYNCKKNGAYFTFEVPDNYIKKVFAIFVHPCYNVTVKQKSVKKKLLFFLSARPCIVAGAAVFAACAVLANCLVLKINVTGSGSYLKNEVLAIACSYGVNAFSFYNGTDEPAICSQVMALPSVTFCSLHKSGSVLYIDVQVQEESGAKADYSDMYSDVSGTVNKITAVCGTPLVSAGDNVAKGDMLIGAYYLSGDDKIPCLAVGYAKITSSASVSMFYDCESEQNRQAAYAATLLYAEDERVLSRGITVKTVADGVIYTVDFTYLHTISINFG